MLPNRIIQKIERVTESGCWIWMGACNRDGYACVSWRGQWASAHRVIYTELVGLISDGLTIDHLCRVRCCVNPDHLEMVTVRENTIRGESCSAMNARRVLCARGHEFDGIDSQGKRRCLTCYRQWFVNNHEKVRASAHALYLSQKELRQEKMQAYYQANKEKWIQYKVNARIKVLPL